MDHGSPAHLLGAAAPADVGRRFFVGYAAAPTGVGDLRKQSRALSETKDAAEQASKVKSEFLASMSHELRTPMNSIMGFTSRLIKKIGGSLSERDLDALETVDRNAKHLLGLINDILDLSKIEAGKLELQRTEFDLVRALRDVYERTSSLVDEKPIKLKLNLPEQSVQMDGDRTKIIQAVTNLVSNAIKYTDEGTVTITLNVMASPSGNSGVQWAHISVTDTGIGISPEDRQRLFTKFTQLDSGADRKIGGTGLGLVITSQLVDLHGGGIDVESEPGKGSTFTIRLPLSTVRLSSVPLNVDLGPASQPTLEGITILCVDDEPYTLKFLRLTLEDAGYDVLMANDHDSAIEQASQRKPDLICLDICMPDMDGYEVIKSLRKHPDLSRIPVIVASTQGDEKRATELGACFYFAKPVSPEHLVDQVRQVLVGKIQNALIVEDDPDTSELLRDSLAEQGIEVSTAMNGREGIAKLGESVPSVIVLDLMMPVMDGFEFLGHIQADPVWRNIPVVILTAKTLDAAEIQKLSRITKFILIKGRDDTVRVVEAALKSVVFKQRRQTETHA